MPMAGIRRDACPAAAQPQHRLVQGAIQGGTLPPAVIPGGAVHGEQQARRLAGEQLLRVRLPRLVAKGETRQQGAIQQPLEPGWQVAPPDGGDDHQMVGLHQALLHRLQIGLEGLRLVIAMVKIRRESELPHVMQGDARAPLLGAAGILSGEGVAEAVGFGVAVENKQVGGHGMAP